MPRLPCRTRHLRLVTASLLTGTLITALLAGPGPLLSSWAGIKRGSMSIQPLSPGMGGPWNAGYTPGLFNKTWTLFYPGQYSLYYEEDAKHLPENPPIPGWVIRNYQNSDGAGIYSVATTASGWPFRAMSSLEWDGYRYPRGEEWNRLSQQRADGIAHGWHVGNFTIDDLSTPLVLPLHPLWPGLAADVACWSLASAALLLILSLLRTRSRRRRGLCTACGYSLRGLSPTDACPECGPTPAHG